MPRQASRNQSLKNKTGFFSKTAPRSAKVSRPGFTMIEVVLTLAIGGLIFMGIFIALPNAQMNQRNATRRADFTRLSSAISAYVSDNNGKLPTTAGEIDAKWLTGNTDASGDPIDPNGLVYLISMGSCTIGSATCNPDYSAAKVSMISSTNNTVYVYKNSACDGDGKPTGVNATSRTFAIYGYIENGTNAGDTFCQQSNG